MNSKHLLRILGLSMLVAVGATTMGASAAQAKWLLLANGISVNKLTIVSTKNEFLLLEEGGLGIKVSCKGGTGTTTLTAVEEGKKVTGSGSANWSGCDVVGSSACTVNSPGQADGTIVTKGTGELSHVSDLTYVLLESEEFTTLVFGGVLCPFDEVEAVISGKAHLEIHDALQDTKFKLGLLNELALLFGGNKASLHEAGKSTGAVQVGSTEANGGTWAVHLLPL